MLHGGRHARHSRRSWNLSGAFERITNAAKWASMGSSDKRKKDDDFDVEGAVTKKVFGKGAFANGKGKGKKSVPYFDIVGLLMIGLVMMGGVYTIVHGMTNTLVAPVAIIKMYEPSETDIATVEKLLELHQNGQREDLGNTLMYVVENNCKQQFPFQMGQEASLVFHSHMIEMVNFMANGGDMKSLTEGHVVVGEDGAVYTLGADDAHHHTSGSYSSCDLVNALVWYNHHKQTVHSMTDVDEHWEETYDSWEAKHTSVTGDMNRDARTLMTMLASGTAVDFELDFLDALNTHCQHIMSTLTAEQTTNFVAQGYTILKAINDGAMKMMEHPQIVVTHDGRVTMRDGTEALHYETHMTCPLLDKALHFQPKTLDEKLDTLMAEIGTDIFSIELTIDALINEHCRSAQVNMDADAFRHFHGHLLDFAIAVKEQVALGKNDIVVLRTGEMVHRAEAQASGIAPSQFLSCPLVEALSQRGDHQHKQENVDQFSNNNAEYEELREELTSNAYSKNPTRDVSSLFGFFQNHDMYSFESYLWDTLWAYHGDVLTAMPMDAQSQLHHSFARLIEACLTRVEMDPTHKLAFHKVEGEIYYADGMTAEDATRLVESPLLDELLHYAHFAEVEAVVADYHAEQHSSAELVAEVEHLFEHAATADWFYLQSKMADLVDVHCSGLQDDKARAALDSELLYLVEEISAGTALPESSLWVAKDGGIVFSEGKPEGVVECPLLDEIMILAKAQNKHTHKTAEEKKTDQENLNAHLTHKHEHHKSEGLEHDVDFLINQAKSVQVDDVVLDLVDVLDDHCPEYRDNLRYKAKGVAQGHLLQIVMHLASDRPLDAKIADAVILPSGHIVSEAEATATNSKMIQCPLARELFSR